MRTARALPALLCAGLLSVAVAHRAQAAADSVLVRVGGDLAGRAGSTIDVPVTVDLSGAPGRQLGSYRGQLTWDPTRLEFLQIKAGNFAQPQTNAGAVAGTEQVTAVLPAGAGGVVTVFIAQFYVLSDTAPSPVTVAFDEMSATATSTPPFQILVPLLKYVQGVFCRSLGQWGDVNGDGQSNSLDALVALSVVVGLPVDTLLMQPALGDVDADGSITSRDALIMLSYAVGLPVTGYRVLLPAAGACGTGAAATLVIAPDSVELQAGQGVAVVAQAMDGLGRVVPADSLTWTSSNPAIAGYDPISGQVKGRSAGFATLTAQVGPGVQGTLKVSVIARRSTWFVDVQRAFNAPAQLGTQALPFQFIGDAVAAARDGDTVRVASGTYEEIVQTSVSVALLGDSVNPPVLDPRSYPFWVPYQTTLSLGSSAGPLVVAHLVVRAGGVFLDAHDVTVRDVNIQGLGGTSTFAGLEATSGQVSDAPPARDGRMRAQAPESPGNVLIDGVSVTADSTTNGILVDLADTAVIRNSTITRAAPGQGGCSPSAFTESGILITEASVSVVQNNVVANPECQGIGVYDSPFTLVVSDVGRATISRNRVSGAPGSGIAVGTRLVALDHNTVRNSLNSQFYFGTNVAGLEVVASGLGAATDTVTSRADSVLTVKSYYSSGLRVDTAGVAIVDSLFVDDIGTDSSSSSQGAGLYFTGRRLTLTNSHVSNTHGTGVEARGQMVYRARGNTVRNTQAGIGVLLAGPNCECSTGGPDSVLIAQDSISGTSYTGLEIDRALYAQLDTTVVDSTNGAFYDAIDLSNVPRALVRGSVGRRAETGLYASSVDTLSIVGGLFQANTEGVYVYNPTDTVTISGVTVDNNAGPGIYLDFQANARIDSLVATDNVTGLDIAYLVGAAVQRSRFENNDTGMWMETNAQDSSSVVNSNFVGNVLAGVRNDAYSASEGVAWLAADTNYWNDLAGPTCNPAFTGFSCPGVTGDSIVTAGVTFGGFLTGAAPTPAGRMRPVVVASRSSHIRQAPAVRQLSRPQPRPAGPSVRPAVAPPRATVVRVTAPRPPRVKVAPWHKASRSTGIRVSRKS